MSFNLKDLKIKREQKTSEIMKEHVDVIVMGDNLKAICTYLNLKKNYPSKTIKVFSEKPLSLKKIRDTYVNSISLIRDESTVNEMKQWLTPINGEFKHDQAQFYKDGKWHDFFSRAKSMEIQKGEQFFISTFYQMNWDEVFKSEIFHSLDQYLAEDHISTPINSIHTHLPEDLIHTSHWKLTLKDFREFTCEDLYLGCSSSKLNTLFSKSSMSDDFYALLAHTQNLQAIQVGFQLVDLEQFDIPHGSLFIPQSQTHERGHFIFERNINNQLNAAFILPEDEDQQMEDLASQIKLLKRSMERVWPGITKSIICEEIKLSDPFLTNFVEDKFFETLEFDYPHLNFCFEDFWKKKKLNFAQCQELPIQF